MSMSSIPIGYVLFLGFILMLIVIMVELILAILHSLTNKKIFWKLSIENIFTEPKGAFEILIAILFIIFYFVFAAKIFILLNLL